MATRALPPRDDGEGLRQADLPRVEGVLSGIQGLSPASDSAIKAKSTSHSVATGLDALTINLSCAFLLTRYRHHGGSLTKAAFLSARNDALANIAIIGAGIATVFTRSLWPDLIVGLGIAVMNLDAARAVWNAARREHAAVQP